MWDSGVSLIPLPGGFCPVPTPHPTLPHKGKGPESTCLPLVGEGRGGGAIPAEVRTFRDPYKAPGRHRERPIRRSFPLQGLVFFFARSSCRAFFFCSGVNFFFSAGKLLAPPDAATGGFFGPAFIGSAPPPGPGGVGPRPPA